MSIRAIRNQPFQFGNNLYPRSLALMCCADDPVPSLIAATDEVWAQATLTPCGDEEGIILTGGADNWPPPGVGDTPGWVAEDGWFINGEGFYRYGGGVGNNRLIYDLLQSTLGSDYTIEITVSNVTGSFYVSFGEQDFLVTADGTYMFMVQSAGEGPFVVGNISGNFTVESVTVTALNTDVSAIFHQGSTELVFDRDDYPDNFYFFNGGFTFHMPMSTVGITEGCFTLELRDNCSATNMTSQVFRIVDVNCETFLIRACNDYDNIGFVVPFVPRIRIPASMAWPSYNTDVQEERHSDGEIFRPYGDRTRTMTVKTEILNEFDHAFLSTLPLWDHVYIGTGVQAQEVVVSKGKYEPLYGEDQNLNGSVVFDVAPKAELVRKVRCGPALEGCAPESDPICFAPEVAFTFTPVDGGFNLNARIYSTNTSFPLGPASVTAGSGAPVVKYFGALPDTQAWGPFASGTSLVFRLNNSMNQNCVITKFFDVPAFVCEGEGYGTLVTNDNDEPSGAYDFIVTSSTGHFAVRDASTGSVTVDPSLIPPGTYCFFSCDELGNKDGVITEIDSESGGITTIQTGAMPITFFQSAVGGMSPLPSMAENVEIAVYNILDNSVADTLPDFNPASETSIQIECPSMYAIGVLPQITNLDIFDSAITDPSVVDAFVNALQPSASGTCNIGSTLLGLRTSASDTNYNACVSAGWTFS